MLSYSLVVNKTFFGSYGSSIMNKGFSIEMLHQFGDIVRLNRDRVEKYIDNGDDLAL